MQPYGDVITRKKALIDAKSNFFAVDAHRKALSSAYLFDSVTRQVFFVRAALQFKVSERLSVTILAGHGAFPSRYSSAEFDT